MRTKTRLQREQDRQRAPFTILSCRETFIQRLLAERIVIITAGKFHLFAQILQFPILIFVYLLLTLETGSGKTTQLPQYCAEALEDGRLHGVSTANAGKQATLGVHEPSPAGATTASASSMTYCTQPRKFAARSIARRVSEEFDGTSRGPSVGYTVGGAGDSKRGSRIVFCTDAMLVRKAQRDPLLQDISVLIIDEAHERSLYTDIVLGIAKNLLAQRDNFYVVVASATIEPAAFLNFFFGNLSPLPQPLKVPGRVYEIKLLYRPPATKSTGKIFNLIASHIVPQTQQALNEFKEGHVLVFLPGQGDITKALKAFEKLNLKGVHALPLYGGLDEVDQDKVMNFDKNNTGMRMVVFCTNGTCLML